MNIIKNFVPHNAKAYRDIELNDKLMAVYYKFNKSYITRTVNDTYTNIENVEYKNFNKILYNINVNLKSKNVIQFIVVIDSVIHAFDTNYTAFDKINNNIKAFTNLNTTEELEVLLSWIEL